MESTTEDTQKESADNAAANIANVTSVPPPVEPKKGRKEERSKKDDKNLEQFMRSLNSIPTLEDKLSLVCKKYVQTSDDNKKMQFYIKQSDKRYALLLKEKEQLQLEFNKTILLKSKLENLCRELQKQNKAIKEESLLKIREEEERRKETQAKFQSTLTEITNMLQQNNEKNAKLRDDNISMTEKFKSVVTQYQLREQQVDKMSKQMALESQLSEAKMQKASLEHQADKERLLSEMEQLKVTIATYRAKIMESQATETNLRSQLAVYTEKYDEFQNALVKSNQMFSRFKVQMDKMSKKIKKLEKESLSWKTKWETSQTALLDMCGERQTSEEKAASSSRQLLHMQSLCRTLQAERTVLLNTLKEHNIERPPLPPPVPVASAPAPPAPPAPQPNPKVDAMAANCAQLRQSLAHLQTQLNVLTNKQKEESPKPEAKPEKQEKKKSKSKKNKNVKNVENTPKEEIDDVDLIDEILPISGDNMVGDAEKVDETTLENLIQAINNANINLCDLEVVSDEIAETSGVKITEIIDEKDKSIEINELVEPKGVKISEIREDKSTNINELVEQKGVKISEIKEDKGIKIDKLVEQTGVKISEIIDDKDIKVNDSKVIECVKITNIKEEKKDAKINELIENKENVKINEINEKGSQVLSSLTDKSTAKNELASDVTTKNEITSIVREDEIEKKPLGKVEIVLEETKSIVESSNDEVSHVNEVKPISNTT